MKIAALFFLLSTFTYAQSTINHQGHATENDVVVIGVGSVDMGFSTSTRSYERTAMINAENHAMDLCACGTSSLNDCMERVSSWEIYRAPDRSMFPSTWFTTAVAKFRCF